MATDVEPVQTKRALEGEQRVVIRDVDWEGYGTMLRLVGDRPVRLTYHQSQLELMSLTCDHRGVAKWIGRVVESVTEELRIPRRGLGSTTWRKKAEGCGLEADRCYYLASLPRVRGKWDQINLDVDPPPDLAIDVEISPCTLDRMAVYAALDVPEVWRFDGETLTVHQLQSDGTYAAVPASPGLPMLPLDEVVRWVRLGETIEDDSEWGRGLREWVRAELLPRHGGR